MWKQIKSWFTGTVPPVLILITLMIAALALVRSWNERVEVNLNDGATVPEAEYILERANDAAEFANSILSFIEGVTAVITVVLIAGGWMFSNSIQRQREELQGFVARTQDELNSRQKHLEELEKDLQNRIDQVVQKTTEEFTQTREKAADSFRVLSLQLLAEQQVRAHNIDTAITTLREAHEISPADHVTNYLLGYLYAARLELDAAIAHLQKALDSAPDFAPGMAALGLALRHKGDRITDPDRITERNQLWAQAESRLLEALRRDPSLTDADGESYYGSLGGLYRRQKRYGDALDAYTRAQQVTPDSSYPLINLAAIHMHEGHQPEAQAYFELVLHHATLELDDDPRNVWARGDQAQAYLILKQPQKALVEMRKVIEQNPERGVLETVRSGLNFLAESSLKIEGLDEMIHLIDDALRMRDDREQSQPAGPGQ